MPLVEIIVGGEKTSDKAIAAAVDHTVAIKKVPIVVNDSRGFFTSRCFGTYVTEGMFLLEEGVPAPMIERVATKIGLPVGPLAVHDEVSLTLSVHIFESDPAEKSAAEKRSYAMVKDLVENHQRTGKRDGAGFYDYPKGGQKETLARVERYLHAKRGCTYRRSGQKTYATSSSFERAIAVSTKVYFDRLPTVILVLSWVGASPYLQVEHFLTSIMWESTTLLPIVMRLKPNSESVGTYRKAYAI